jgi:outer membrane immunogenic protein
MKKTILVGLALAALMAPPVVAAERPITKAPPPPSAPVYPWNGCYVGGNFGFVGVRNKISWDGVRDGDDWANGPAGGGQIGCDFQWTSNWVIGIQGLIDGTNPRVTQTPAFLPVLPETPPVRLQSRTDWFATIAGRIGYAINPSLLVYGKFGWGVFQTHADVVATDLTGVVFGSQSRNRSGFDFGGGVEFMLPKLIFNWSLWIEYDHILPRDTTLFLPLLVDPLTGTGETVTIRRDLDKVLLGLNWRFNSPIAASTGP